MPRRHGLTLVELLVVIALIAVLISLLFPVLGKARDQARTTQCASNMRQLYAAVMSYAADYDRTLPAAPFIEDATGSKTASRCAFTMVQLGVIDFDHNAPFWQYLGDRQKRQQIFTCPADAGERPYHQAADVDVVRNFSYSFSGQVNWDPSMQYYDQKHEHSPLRLTSILSPAHKILIWEEFAPNDGTCWCLWPNDEDYPSSRHNRYGSGPSTHGGNGGRGNQVFADGHIECVEPRDVFANPWYCDILQP